MLLVKRILFSLVPLVILLAVLEVFGLVWERFDPPSKPLPIPRSAEKLPAKVPGEFRVLLYGGSTVVGLPEPKFGFVPQMRFYLGELLSHEKTEIFNYAVSGQPSADVVCRLDRTVRGSEADAIVVLWNWPVRSSSSFPNSP